MKTAVKSLYYRYYIWPDWCHLSEEHNIIADALFRFSRTPALNLNFVVYYCLFACGYLIKVQP